MRVLICIAAAGLLLAACVTAPPGDAPPPVSALQMYEAGHADGVNAERAKARAAEAAIRASERARIAARLRKTVSPYAGQTIDTRESWLNDHGTITLERMAFAREREMRVKLQCAEQYRDLSDAFGAELQRLTHEQ